MTPLDHVREAIRAAVSRANPIEEARRSVELIAETSVRFSEQDGQPSIYVIDGGGQRRTKRRFSSRTLRALLSWPWKFTLDA